MLSNFTVFRTLLIVLYFTLVFHTKTIECGVTVHTPPSLSGKNIYATSLKFEDSDELLLSGNVVKANPFSACSKLKNTNINNNTIVLYSGNFGDGNCRPKERLENILNSGAAGCIVYWSGILSGHGVFTFTYDMDGVDKVPISGVEIMYDKEFIDAVMDHKNVTVTITSDKNGFLKVKETGGFDAYTVLFSLYSAGCAAFAGYKLFWFRRLGARHTVPQIALWFEITAAILRILHTIDPYWVREYYPFWLGSFLISAHFPFTFMSVILITFYWEECLRGMTIKVFPNLDRMWYPFIGVAIFLAFLEFSSSLIRGFRVGSFPWILRATAIMYGVIAFATFLFFIVTGGKIFRVLVTSKAVNAKRAAAVKRLTLLVMLNGILLLFFVIIASLAAFVTTNTASVGLFVWSLNLAILQTVGLIQIASFKIPSSQYSASKSPSYNQTAISRVASSVDHTTPVEQLRSEEKVAQEEVEMSSEIV